MAKMTEQQRIQFAVMLNKFEDDTAELKKMEILNGEDSEDANFAYWKAASDLIKYKVSIINFVEAL